MGGTPLDPFAVDDALTQAGITEKSVSTNPSGHYIISTIRWTDTDTVRGITKLPNGQEVIAEIFEDRKKTKGVINCPNIKDMDPKVLKTKLEKQDVTAVEKRGKNGTFVLTFATDEAPESIKVGAIPTPVRMYYPRPRQCTKCYMFGHLTAVCRNKAVCPRCGGPPRGERCDKPLKCANCGGKHTPSYDGCPMWAQEAKICRIAADRNITNPEARKIYASDNTLIEPAWRNRKRIREKACYIIESSVTSGSQSPRPSSSKDPGPAETKDHQKDAPELPGVNPPSNKKKSKGKQRAPL